MEPVPYQAYKSKRHSRTLSTLSSAPLSTSPPSRPASAANFVSEPVKTNGRPRALSAGPQPDAARRDSVSPPSDSASPPMSPASPKILSAPLASRSNGRTEPAPDVEIRQPVPTTRRTSTFRRVPLRDARPSLPSSPLRSSHLQPPNPSLAPNSPLRNEQNSPSNPSPPDSRTNSQPLTPEPRNSPAPIPAPSPPAPKPPPKTSASTSMPPTPRATSPQSASTPAPRPITRFYRPGFQPPGVYRPRTDQFIEARKAKRAHGRIETTRLERRLEKLINLHFSDVPEKPVQPPPLRQRRASSFFEIDFSDLRNKSAGDLWKGVLQAQAPGGKGDIRSAEQKITPWEDDASVSQCPLCLTSFHPITCRKHHCRLCGRIVCSLPVKAPQRPVTCSLLFVADLKTGKIEEVGEGVDYGVRRRTISHSQGGQVGGRGKPPQLVDDEKFLKGVRICRECRPVLLRQQYIQEAHSTPVFLKLYDHFVAVEKEIEDALPQFQELLMSLKNDEQPTAEASSARKRLLEAFSQYDALAKRIRKLPCPSGTGSSQDRIQTAILTRANIFLQKNMFPLQSLPKPAQRSTSGPSTPSSQSVPLLESGIDPDSELAHALQPLLEQEALLETFVQEAKSHRKFEDAQTLKANLEEIRAEIDRVVTNAERGRKTEISKGKQRQMN